jgi:F-type H+-transporting ATPase subunit delta
MADFGAVARPYARAIFDVALAADDLDGWSEALAAAAAVAADPGAHEYLTRPELGVAARSDFVGSIAADLPGGRVLGTDAGRNLLKLLSENDRLDALAEISAQFDQLKAERENRVKVTIVAATAVDSATADKIAGALSKKLGRTVELELAVDESLIGGAVIRAQDMVIDDSLQTRLKRLAGTLTD